MGATNWTASGTVVAMVPGGERYRLWTGRSGRRHVFTRVEGAVDPADLDGAVVMIVARRPDGETRPVWIGEAERAPLGGPEGHHDVYAHWLAETSAERRAVIADLGGEPRRTLRVVAVCGPVVLRAA